MPNLHQALGIGDLLDAADASIPGWGLTHPDLGRLFTLDDVSLASRTGSCGDRNAVLLRIARLASTSGGDDREAAAVLCHLLVPGVIAKLGRMRLSVSSNRVDELAAQHLWMQCRTFPWEAAPRVAPSIVWGVRRGVLADLGIADPARCDRTWANTRLLDQELLDYVMAPESVEDPARELAELLDAALADRAISMEQVRELSTLLRVADRHPAKRISTHGLLSAEVSQQVGQELGIGASSVRSRVGRTLNDLRRSVSDAA